MKTKKIFLSLLDQEPVSKESILKFNEQARVGSYKISVPN